MTQAMDRLVELHRGLTETPFPAMGMGVGEFMLYDAYVKGCADAVIARELAPPEPEGFVADGETLRTLSALRAKPDRSPEEQEFLVYYDQLQTVRDAMLATAGEFPLRDRGSGHRP